MLVTQAFILAITQNLFAQKPMPAKPQTKPIVLIGGTAHLGNGQIIENAFIRFEKGIITEITTTNPTLESQTAGADVIRTTGKHIYPGFILPNSSLGLTEIQAVRASNDLIEVGTYNPHIRSLIAYNTDSDIIPTIRNNGVLLVQTRPQGATISGQSSIFELDGWNWEDAVLQPDDGIHLNWIPMFTHTSWREGDRNLKKNENRTQAIADLENFMNEALSYAQTPNPTPKNYKLEAMKGLFDGSKRLYIHVNFSREIVESIQFAQKMKIKKIVVVGGRDALQVADFLRDNQIPVLLERVHRLPSYEEEGVFNPYQLPMLLKKAGILVGLTYDSNEPMGSRNLPFLAGTAAAYGLSKEDALMTITLNTAQILGIDQKVGSLEKGKHATLFVSSGDALDMRTNIVEVAFIQGKQILLEDKQKYLFRMYQEKYNLK
ncbi:MAG: amidohydrolase family protein [Microscillaceae bacterium]|nr:amidohydrolase family protein [Microscillaceae bacterium]MDW8459861.1 amidohydrolase family protein [Cytophagales bacterium]